MTLTDYLADYRTKFPKAAEIPDAELARLVSFKSDFNPEWLRQPTPEAATAPGDTSYRSAILSGVAQPVAAIGESAQVLGEVADSEALKGVGGYLSQAKGLIPQGYKSASEEFVKSWDLSLLPRAVTEQSGQLLGSVASRLAGGAIGGLFSSPTATVTGPVGPAAGVLVGQAVGPALFEGLQLLGSVARERARNDGRTEVTKDDLVVALGTSAVSGALNSIGDRYLGGKGATYLKRLREAVLGEGVTEMGQGIVEQVGGSLATKAGVQVDLKQAAAEGVLGAGSAGVFTTAMEPFVQGEAAPAPAVAPAAQPAAKPVFSYGDIVAPNEAQNYFIAPATIDGEERQFIGATQAEAEAQRDAAIAQLTPAGATPEAARVDQVVREGLMSAGLSADQIAQLSSEQATELLNRVVQQTPDLVDAANAEAVERRTAALANALGNLATAKQAEFDAQLKVADNQAAIDKVTAEAAKWRTEAEASRTKLESLRAQAAEAKARKGSIKLVGEGPVADPEVVPGEQISSPLGQAPSAIEAPKLPAVSLNVAAPTPVVAAVEPPSPIRATVEPTAVSSRGEEAARPTAPVAAPNRPAFARARRDSEIVFEPGQQVELGQAPRTGTRFAAIFASEDGSTQVAIPVFKIGKTSEVRVLLDNRMWTEALGGTLAKQRKEALSTSRRPKAKAAILAIAKEKGMPLDNEATIEEYATSSGLRFTGTIVVADTPLEAGIYPVPTERSAVAPAVSGYRFPGDSRRTDEKAVRILSGYSMDVRNSMVELLRSTPDLMDATDPKDAENFPGKWRAAGMALKVITDTMPSAPESFRSGSREALATAYYLLELARGRTEAAPVTIAKELIVSEVPVERVKITEEEKLRVLSSAAQRILMDIRTNFLNNPEKVGAFIRSPSTEDDLVSALTNAGIRAPKISPEEGKVVYGFLKQSIPAEAPADPAVWGDPQQKKLPPPTISSLGWLRSFLSGYADLSEVSADDVTDALDKAVKGALLSPPGSGVARRVNEEVRNLPNTNLTGARVVAALAKIRAMEDAKVLDLRAYPEVQELSGDEASDKVDSIRLDTVLEVLSGSSLDSVVRGGKSSVSVVADEDVIDETNRPLSAQETQELNGYRGETDTVQFLRNLAARGVNVSFTDLKNAVAGRFSEGHVAIFANWADRASASTFGVALHEATHHFVSQLPPAARLALRRSVDQLTGRLMGRTDVDPRVGYKSYAEYLASKPEQVLTPQAWAEEVIAETAALNGMDRAVSRTMWAMIMRQVKLLALRVNMYLQEQFMGPDGVNPEFVSKWVDAQIDATIAGDALRLMSLATRYSKIRPTLGKMVLNTIDDRHHWQSQQMNPLTGEISYLGSLDSTASAAESRIYQTVAAFKQQAMQNGSWHRAENEEALAGPLGLEKSPVNPIVENASIMIARATESAETSIAAHNELLKPFMAAWGKVQQIMPELSEPSRAMNKRLGLPVPEAMPIERVAQLAGFDLSAADAAKAALVQTVVDETKVTPPAEFTSRLASSLAELKTPGATAAAQQIIFNSARKSASAIARRLAAGNSRLVDLEAVQQRTAARLAKFTTDPKDWKAIDLDIKEKISASFDAILKAKDAFGDSEVQMAEAAALMDKALTRAEARVEFDKNAQDIFAKANIEGITLHSMLRELMALNSDDPYYKYRIDFNWGSKRIYDTVVSYVMENPKSALAELTTQESRGQVRGTAILASLIKYARDNELAIELARAATVKGDLHTAALLEYQAFMRDATDKKLDELAALQKAQKEIPTNRFIQKALNARDKYIKASDDIAVLKQELAVLRVLNGVFQQAKKLAEDSLGYQNEIYTHHPEAMFAHPTSPDDKIEDIFSSPRVKKVGTRSNAELRQVIQDVREYLEANRDRPESKGDLFNRLQRQNIAMIQAIAAPDKVRNARSGLFGALIEGTAGLFRAPGSPSGDRVAARITRYSAILDVLRNVAKKISSDYERNAAAFRKAAGGISDTEFYDNFFTEASNLAQVINADREEIHDRIDQRFSTNESTKEAWAKPGAKRAFWAFLDSVERAAVAAQKMQADHGADLVTDPTTGGFRKQIRRGYLTFPQHTNAALKTWASAVHPDFSADEHPKNFFTKYKLMANADERRAEMDRFLGKDGWDIFLAPLLGNDLESVRGPRHADGSNYNLSTDRAKTLVRLANGDFFRFAELAYLDNHGSSQTLEDYTNSLIDQVGKVWKQVSVHAVDKAPVASLRVNPGIPNIGIDARATQTWPIGWKAPMRFNEDGMRRFIAGVAGVAAFGRDMSDTILDISAMQAEIQNRIDTLKAKYNKPGLSEREQMVDWNMPKRLLTAAGVSSSDWQQYNALQDYAKVDWASRITRSLNPDGTLGLNDKLSMELWGTYVMNLTAGFRSALKNPVSGLNQFALAGEFSPDSVKDTLGNYGQLLKQVAASVAQSLPFVDPLSSDVNAQAMYEMGVYDAVTDVNLSDSLKGGLSSTGEHHPAVTFLRRLKEVYKDTRLGFSKSKRGVALRAFDVFNWSQLTTQMGAVANNLNIYYEIVQRMADYGRSGGNLLVTPNAKQIGLRGSEVRYNNMVKAWEEAGGSDMLTLASELASNPAMSELDIKKRLVPTVNKIVSDRISAASSISANPAWINSSRVGRLGGTFLGWSLRQGGTFAKPFINAETNTVSAASLMRGASMVALGMLPGVLAYSMLLDMFDDMTERKRDKVELRLSSQQSKDNFVQSLVEAIQDVGVFSLPGDLATTLVNAYQGTGNKGPSFSLDNRLVAVSAFNNLTRLFRDLMVYGPENMVLSTSGMQAIQTLGGTAWLSNLETLNRLTGADVGGVLATYGERQDRVSINNYIREAGRLEGLPVRQYGTFDGSNPPAPMSPWISEMQLAALNRDEARFERAKAQAYKIALKEAPSPKEAWAKVATRYASKHPLRAAFKDRITPMEIQNVINRVDALHPGKSKMVQEAMVDFNRFGSRIPLFRPVVGAKPSIASVKRGEEARAQRSASWW